MNTTEENFYNYKIIAIERAETTGTGQSGKKYPMWRCQLEGGKKVNIFKHDKYDRNSHRLFEQYHTELDSMEINDVVTWMQHPIEVHCVPDGQWLKIATVAPRPEGAKPDEEVDNTATQKLARAGVENWAVAFSVRIDTRILDLETSDKTVTSEVLSIAVIGCEHGKVIFKSLVRPTNPNFVNHAEHVNGITPDMLKDAPTLAEIYPQICDALAFAVVGIYNAEFDEKVLQNALIRAGLKPVPILATACVMKQFAMYRGEWNSIKQDWRWATLSEAAARFGIETPEAHGALPDCRTTLEIIKAMAAGQPLDEVEPF